jgi:hypothetical protein
MKAVSLDQSGDDAARWITFLSRWALATVLFGIVGLVIYFMGVGFVPSDNALGIAYSDLMQAVRAPVMFRIFMTFDAIGWLMIGGTLLTLAAILKSRAPIRTLMVAACGIGMLAGSLGGFMRLVGVSDLAAQYSVATTAQQAALLPSGLALYETISAHFVAGGFLQGAAYLLIASMMFALRAFPRWLVGWFILAGILEFLQMTTAALGAFSFIVLFLTVIVGVWGLNIAIMLAFWRPSAARLSATANG